MAGLVGEVDSLGIMEKTEFGHITKSVLIKFSDILKYKQII